MDSNILVYAHRTDSPWHKKANQVLLSLSEGDRMWSVPWHCLHEFFSNVTHRRIYIDPTPAETALEAVADWLASPTVEVLRETPDHLQVVGELIRRADISGPAVYDARIAAVCLENGVQELWSADRDYSRFPQLKTVNPLVN